MLTLKIFKISIFKSQNFTIPRIWKFSARDKFSAYDAGYNKSLNYFLFHFERETFNTSDNNNEAITRMMSNGSVCHCSSADMFESANQKSFVPMNRRCAGAVPSVF